jgi:hypothetical protein
MEAARAAYDDVRDVLRTRAGVLPVDRISGESGRLSRRGGRRMRSGERADITTVDQDNRAHDPLARTSPGRDSRDLDAALVDRDRQHAPAAHARAEGRGDRVVRVRSARYATGER